VTVQRVSIKRGNKTMESLWKAINGLKGSYGGQGERKVVKERAERGARVGDFSYQSEGLDLGLLKGNMFRITLR
jgi:tRNA pseudouridine13 synthase